MFSMTLFGKSINPKQFSLLPVQQIKLAAPNKVTIYHQTFNMSFQQKMETIKNNTA